jgi:hypothetical protein
MRKLSLALILVIAGCSPKAEFSPQTVQAYQTDDALRTATLQKCGDHAANHTPFAIQSDTDECQKAATAQGNINYAAHVERERQADARLAAEINGIGSNSSGKH